MAKYSFEFKKKVVLEYLSTGIGYNNLAKKYGIASYTPIRFWINAYKEFGDKGILRSRQNKKYSFTFKLRMVELYLSNEVSYQDLALSQGMNNPCMLVKWVNDFRIGGVDALRPKKKGRKKTLNINNTRKPSSSADTEDKTIDTSVEHVKELENELLKLRIENAYLKELRRLRLEDEARMRDLQESSTVSEESSN